MENLNKHVKNLITRILKFFFRIDKFKNKRTVGKTFDNKTLKNKIEFNRKLFSTPY